MVSLFLRSIQVTAAGLALEYQRIVGAASRFASIYASTGASCDCRERAVSKRAPSSDHAAVGSDKRAPPDSTHSQMITTRWRALCRYVLQRLLFYFTHAEILAHTHNAGHIEFS